ncbi:hypothetical protein Ancab_005652 [Ancistrocladus abbreviatus]
METPLIIDPWGAVVGRLPDRLSTGIVGADIDFSLMDSIRTMMPLDKISEVFWDYSLHGETENHKDSPSPAIVHASGDSRHKRSSSKWKDDLSPASSTVTESNQVGELISGSKLPTGEITMSNEMDLLVEQLKMLAGDIAFSTSTLKCLLEQFVNDPDALKTQYIQNLEREIQEKRMQMRILEQRIIQSGEASVSNASLVDMQQTVMRLMTQCNEKSFELEFWFVGEPTMSCSLLFPNKCISSPLKPLLIARKPVQNEELRKIETIINHQIKAELDVYAKRVTLSDAKRINGLRAVFGEIYPDPIRVVSIGKKVDHLLADPDNAEWLSYSAKLCGGTHLSNTKEAKAFALISEEGIAKGVRRVTAVTADCAFEALELAHSLDQEAIDAAKIKGSMLEKEKVRKGQKKIAEENMQKAVKAACEKAEAAVSDGKGFCISFVGVGLDAIVVREAVLKVIQQKVPHHFGFPSGVIHFAFNSNILITMWMDEQGISTMIFSVDETTNKAVVYAGVPDKGNTSQAGSSANAFIWE